MGYEVITLSNWEKAKTAIALCKSIDEVKQIRDQAQALRAYAQQRNESFQVQNAVAEIKIRAERRLGEISRALSTEQGIRKDLTSSQPGKRCKEQVLRESGINTSVADRCEDIADIPEQVFESHIKEMRDSKQELTSVGMLKLAYKQKQEERNRKKYSQVDLPDDIFQVILADPPFEYRDRQDTEYLGGAAKHYPTMSLDQICALPVSKLSSKDSVLFLWVPAPLIPAGCRVVEAWGYEYKTNIIWDKVKHCMGHYTSVRHEHLFVAVKGSFTPETKKLFDSVVVAERSNEHSLKPKVFHEMIETLYPSAKKLELFARELRKNWMCWGNELPMCQTEGKAMNLV